jgi:uncharacterized membrane protein YfcA
VSGAPAVDWVLLTLWLLIFVSATLQSVSGFGFALLSAPILTAVLGGPLAVSTVLITGTACDLAILGMRRRLPRPVAKEVWWLALWSVPGMAAGAVLLAQLPARWLQVFVAFVVVAAVAMRVRSEPSNQTVPSTWAAGAGLTSGALSTSTSLGGPPTVLYLSHRNLAPHVMRDTLVALSLARLPLSVIALALVGVWEVYPAWPLLIPAALAGQVVGTHLFHRFAASRYDRVATALLLVSALSAFAAATQ